jgi:hypothetical protein
VLCVRVLTPTEGLGGAALVGGVLQELDDSTKGLEVWHGADFCCVDVRSLLQTSRVYHYTLVLTRLLVDYEYNI